jgi:RhtB (resistance to homoserine/threonine) family protein
MSYLPHLLTLAGVWFVVVISPGPNFVATIHHAIARSRRDGLLVALGVALGTTMWVTLSIMGLGVLFVRLSWLVGIIRTLGALYLIFLGIRMIWAAHWQKHSSESEPLATPHGSAWRTGLLTNISNPKTAAFFASFFAVLLPTNPPLWFQIMCIITIVLISVSWYSAVACLFSLKPVAHAYRRIKKYIDTITGGILVALGIRLAVSK